MDIVRKRRNRLAHESSELDRTDRTHPTSGVWGERRRRLWFLVGAGSILDIDGRETHRSFLHLCDAPDLKWDDLEALWGDWAAVGNDFRISIGSINPELTTNEIENE